MTSSSDSLCIVRVGMARFGIETAEIREVLPGSLPQPVPLAPAFVAGVLSYRGEILCVLSLRELFRLEEPDTYNNILVFFSPEHNELFGVAVDGVDGVTPIEPGSWQENPATLDNVSTTFLRGCCRDDRGLILRLSLSDLAPARLIQNDPQAEAADLTLPETACSL